jgi:hypothetical protein
MKHRYKIGDVVVLPLKRGVPHGFSSQTAGIPDELIMHGNLSRTEEGIAQTGEIVAIHDRYYIVRFKGDRSRDNTGYLKLGFIENQLILYKRERVGEEENYLFNIEDL